MLRFTELSDRLPYPGKQKGQLSTVHSDIITYAAENFRNKASFKNDIVNAINTISYLIMKGDSVPDSWKPVLPLENLPIVEETVMKDYLGNMYVSAMNLIWDVEESEEDESDPDFDDVKSAKKLETFLPVKNEVINPTPPEHLYLQGPVIPRIDTSKIWRSGMIDGLEYTIYESIPSIPRNQSEISATTKVHGMTPSEYMNLYPNRMLYTRQPELYAKLDGVNYDDNFGLILPIKGFTKKQLIDNVIKYPHLENILREGKVLGERKLLEFWKFIEIDGQLYKTKDVWSTLPESKLIPKSKAYMLDYVIRRYLLERDIKGIDHKYKMFGSLDPFLTLVMPSDDYIRYGYTDVLSIATQCVQSRVSYKQTRNPVIRRLNEVV